MFLERVLNESNQVLSEELLVADWRVLRFLCRYINDHREIHDRKVMNNRRMFEDEALEEVVFRFGALYSPVPAGSLAEAGTASELRNELMAYFSGCSQSQDAQEEAKENFRALMRAHYFVPLERIEWLKKNKNACLFFFLSMVAKRSIPNLSNGLSAARREFQYAIPQDHKSRYELFLAMLDDSAAGNKTDYLTQQEQNYADARKRVKPLAWLQPGNGDACQWAWSYLLNFHESKVEALNQVGAQTDLGYEIATIPLLFWLEPHGEEDQQMAFYAALQTWRCSPAELTLFRTNISKAWRQRQLRRSDEVRPINTHISVKSKEQLDALSRCSGLSLQKVLEAMILKAFREMKGK